LLLSHLPFWLSSRRDLLLHLSLLLPFLSPSRRDLPLLLPLLLPLGLAQGFSPATIAALPTGFSPGPIPGGIQP
jgi:hypothetical protein